MVEADVLVVGAGAIGGGLAARMAGGLRRLVVLDAGEEHVARMRETRPRGGRAGHARTVRLDAVSRPEELEGTFDLALVGREGPAPPRRARAATWSARWPRPTSPSATGSSRTASPRSWGATASWPPCVGWGGQNLGPGRIVRDTEGPVVVGELDGEERPRTRLLAEALGLAGETRITRNARGMIWSKLLVNSAFTGLSAVSGLRYGGVAEHPAGREAVLGLWREGYDVGRAEGLELDRVFDMEPEEMLADGPRGRAHAEAALERSMVRWGPVLPSMLQDLQQGRLTEVDVVNGGVAGRGRAHGVPTPLNDRVVDLVHAMERDERRPEPAALEEVAALLP